MDPMFGKEILNLGFTPVSSNQIIAHSHCSRASETSNIYPETQAEGCDYHEVGSLSFKGVPQRDDEGL